VRVVAELRVRYGDTDAAGLVYYANYLRYFEAARVEYLRQLGQTYREIEAGGVVMAVTQAICRYHAPARFDDLLALSCRIADLRRASFAFEYEIHRLPDGVLIASGRTEHACVDRETLRPVRMPEPLRALVAAFEAGPSR
jgi:acyl-CoA thioester hydrolase